MVLHIVPKLVWYKTHTYIDGKPSRGLSKTCRLLFFPQFSARNLPALKKTQLPLQKRRKLKYAKRHGKCVDACLQRWTSDVQRGGQQSTIVRISSVKEFIKYCNDHKWQPVASQLPVAGPVECRIATCLDLLMHDTINGRLLVVEIKTGHMQHDTVPVRGRATHFKPPFKQLPCTQTNQHALQALMGKALLMHTYTSVELHNLPVTACVVYLRDHSEPEIVHEAEFAHELLRVVHDTTDIHDWFKLTVHKNNSINKKKSNTNKKRVVTKRKRDGTSNIVTKKKKVD